MSMHAAIINAVLSHHPDVQAIYLFGSYGTKQEWPDSDVDIAVLLSADKAKVAGNLAMSPLQSSLERSLGKTVDLINLRRASTVFQKEIISSDRRIYCADQFAADEFEMLVLSFYQKLNEERAEVMAAGLESGRFYAP